MVVRPFHLLESSRLLEAPDSEIELYKKLNPDADEEELRRFIGDGMGRRYVVPVSRRTVRRLLEYKFALAVRRAVRAVVPLQRKWRARCGAPRPDQPVVGDDSQPPSRGGRYPVAAESPIACHLCHKPSAEELTDGYGGAGSSGADSVLSDATLDGVPDVAPDAASGAVPVAELARNKCDKPGTHWAFRQASDDDSDGSSVIVVDPLPAHSPEVINVDDDDE